MIISCGYYKQYTPSEENATVVRLGKEPALH